MQGRVIGMAGAALVLTLCAACGGDGASEPPPTLPEPTATRSPRPTATAEATAAATPHVVATPASRCPDPYAEGAPYEPTPGAPIRLRPGAAPPEPAAYAPAALVRDRDLEEVVQDAIGTEEEHFAVVVKNLDDGKGVSMDAERSFYAASLYKTWVMLELLHQRNAGLLDFDEELIVSEYYESLGLNTGELKACDHVTMEEALRRMMSFSDNVAANMLLDRAGVWNVNIAVRALGLEATGFVDGTLPTTAADTALLLEAIASGGALNEGSSAEMILLLGTEVIDNRLPALLPAGTKVAHKTGSWDTATHDAGIVFSPEATYVIVVLTDYGYADGGAERIARLSRAVYDYYNP